MICLQSSLQWWLAIEATPEATGLLKASINIEAEPL